MLLGGGWFLTCVQRGPLLFFLLLCYAHTLPASGVKAASGLVSELLAVTPIVPGVTAGLAVRGGRAFSVLRPRGVASLGRVRVS